MKSESRDGTMNNAFMEKLVAFVTETTYEHLSNDMVTLSKQAIIDTMGVSLAGWHEPAVQKVKHLYVSSGTRQSGGSSLWGDALQVVCEKAALINGTASHVLDYDDASPGVVIHPSAPILSAITPLAEQLQRSGKEVITAYAIGTEVMVRVGQIMGIQHYHLGWHATDTLGTIGAAAACAYLHRLDAEQSKHAIAIAASMAGGLQKNFGSMTKPLHVGLAASHGVQAVQLAAQGFTGNPHIFSTRGFFMAFSGGIDEALLQTKLDNIQFGQPYDLLTGLSVKKFPCCFGTHRFIHGALMLKEEHDIEVETIEEIVLRAQPRSLLPLVHSRPVTGLQGKFSAEYTVLAALFDGHVSLSSFEDTQVQREKIQQLLHKVKVVTMEESEEDKRLNRRLPVDICIKQHNQCYEKTVLHAPGSIENPMSEQEHRDKWISCVSHYAQHSHHPSDIQSIANALYDQGLQMDSYTCFSEWIQAIHEQLTISTSKQLL